MANILKFRYLIISDTDNLADKFVTRVNWLMESRLWR